LGEGPELGDMAGAGQKGGLTLAAVGNHLGSTGRLGGQDWEIPWSPLEAVAFGGLCRWLPLQLAAAAFGYCCLWLLLFLHVAVAAAAVGLAVLNR
jgi:hypothetical protein